MTLRFPRPRLTPLYFFLPLALAGIVTASYSFGVPWIRAVVCRIRTEILGNTNHSQKEQVA